MENTKPQGSYFKAILIAFLYGLIGVAAYVVVGGFLGFVSAYISFGIAFGIKKGYESSNGPKKGKIFIIILIYLLQIFISFYLTYFIIVSSVLRIEFLQLFQVLSLPEVSSELTGDYITIGIFAALGLGFFFLNLRSENLNKKFNETSQAATLQNRFSQTISFEGDFEALDEKIKNLLAENKFELKQYGEEQLYKNGNGVWVAKKYFNYTLHEKEILIEAFIIIENKEHALEGFVGSAAKKPLKKFVNQVIALIEAENVKK